MASPSKWERSRKGWRVESPPSSQHSLVKLQARHTTTPYAARTAVHCRSLHARHRRSLPSALPQLFCPCHVVAQGKVLRRDCDEQRSLAGKRAQAPTPVIKAGMRALTVVWVGWHTHLQCSDGLRSRHQRFRSLELDHLPAVQSGRRLTAQRGVLWHLLFLSRFEFSQRNWIGL